MSLQNTTPVPNRLFDMDLISLKEVELKVLLVIIRKTLGWVDEKNNRQRKQISRIPITGFVVNTGCSKRGISTAIDALVQKKLITVYDENGNILTHAEDRKGKFYLYFKAMLNPVDKATGYYNTSANSSLKPVQNLPNTIKEISQKKKNTLKGVQHSQNFYHITRYLNNYTYDR